MPFACYLAYLWQREDLCLVDELRQNELVKELYLLQNCQSPI